jgi:hypothetical protein
LADRILIKIIWLIMRWLFGLTVVVCRGDPAKNAELLVLRHENAVLRRNAGRVRYEPADRACLAALTRFIPRHRWAEVSPVTPATLLARFQKSRLAGPARPLNGVQGHRNRNLYLLRHYHHYDWGRCARDAAEASLTAAWSSSAPFSSASRSGAASARR